MLQFSVNGQVLQRLDQTDDFSSAVFSFDSTWDGANRSALFLRGEEHYSVMLVADACPIPWEVVDGGGYFEVSVFGGSFSTNTVLVTVPPRVLLEDTVPRAPSPGYFDAIVTEVLGATDAAKQSETAAQAAKIGAQESLTQVVALEDNVRSKAGEVASARQTVISYATSTSASEAVAAQRASAAKGSADAAKASADSILGTVEQVNAVSDAVLATEGRINTAAAAIVEQAGKSEFYAEHCAVNEINSLSYSNLARSASEAANTAKTDAITAKDGALAARSDAMEAAYRAGQVEANIATRCNDAEAAKVAAEAAKTAAEVAVPLAKAHSEAAAEHARVAGVESGVATDAAGRADGSASVAVEQANAATLAQTLAQAAKGAAEAARATAEGAATTATTKAGEAGGYATDAETAQGKASAAQVAAEAAKAQIVTDEAARQAAELTRAAFYDGFNDQISDIKIKSVETQENVADVFNALSLVNVNQESKQSATGYGVVALPKTAANGGVSIGLQGLTATNMVKNGDFSQGATGWYYINHVNIADGRATFAANGGNYFLQQSALYPVATKTDHKLYLSYTVVENTLVGSTERFRCGGWDVSDFCSTTPIGASVGVNSSIITVRAGNANTLTMYIPSEYTSGTLTIDDIMIVDLTAEWGAANEPDVATCDLIYADWFNGTKSVSGAGRLRSTAEPDSETAMYYKSNVALRSLPAMQDVLRQKTDGGIEVVGYVGKEVIDGTFPYSAIADLDTVYRIAASGFATGKNVYYKSADLIVGRAISRDGDFLIKGNMSISQRQIALYSNASIYISIEKTKVDAMAGATTLDKAKAYLNQYPITLYYQLATPTVTPISHSGAILSHPSGTVYQENALTVAGVYGAAGIAITYTGYPIASLEKIYQLDYATGIETELDISAATVAADGLSFTHTGLTEGDIVFFSYFYTGGLKGKVTVTHYDGRYVLSDTANSKQYAWKITSTNGVASISLTEV